ncbi:MAG: transcription termination/antitermination factor NusG [Clostridia bacterium]|nr:transcription termination/antitermination factor NusG [Clostridia bacterium]
MSDSDVLKEDPKWYVLHTYSGYESMVQENLYKTIDHNKLQDFIVEVKIPMEDAIEEKNGKKKVVQRKMFPCYVFIKMRYTDNLWHTIVNTRGVTGFVGPAGRPLPLPDEEVRKMQLEKIVIDLKIEVGNKVKVIAGPLESFVGDVLSVDTANQKCKVSVEMFGRQTPVDLDFAQIEVI